jgi:hypothetical protein
MSDTSQISTDTVLDGLVTRAELARQLACSERTIIRHEKQGLPVLRIGMKRLYEIDRVRGWLLNGGVRPDTRRGRAA